MMLSRRAWLAAMAASTLTSAPLSTPGLELYSLRREMDKDIDGTLRLVRSWGISEVEVPQLYGRSARSLRTLLERNGLRCTAMVAQGDRLRSEVGKVIEDARELGAGAVICPWINHDTPQLQLADCLKAADEFNRWGESCAAFGLEFCYHPHGYEFAASPEGTLLDTLMAHTSRKSVHYQLDTFWIAWAGQQPEHFLRKYPGRFPLMHLKDVQRGEKGNQTGQAPESASVALGQGSLDFRSILAAASASGVRRFYIEDESPSAVQQIPASLRYLKTL